MQRNWQHRVCIHQEVNQSKNTTQYVLHTTIPKQTQIAEIRHEPSYQQLEVKTNRTSLLCGNRNGTQNVKTHNRTTQKIKKMSSTDPTEKPLVKSGARDG